MREILTTQVFGFSVSPIAERLFLIVVKIYIYNDIKAKCSQYNVSVEFFTAETEYVFFKENLSFL